MSAHTPLRTMLMGATLVGFLSALPFEVQLGEGLLLLKPSVAFAKDGRDDDKDDDRDDDREDNSGRGSGGDHDRRDDNSGQGGDDNRDDNRGRGRDGDDSADRGRGGDDGGIEVMLNDGSRVEIENGRFERKDARGRTVEERSATAADVARYASDNVAPRGNRRGGGVVAKAEREGSSIEVVYNDGWKEEIEGGRYELKDNLNRTVVERPATNADLRRLQVAFR